MHYSICSVCNSYINSTVMKRHTWKTNLFLICLQSRLRSFARQKYFYCFFNSIAFVRLQLNVIKLNSIHLFKFMQSTLFKYPESLKRFSVPAWISFLWFRIPPLWISCDGLFSWCAITSWCKDDEKRGDLGFCAWVWTQSGIHDW